MKLSDWKLKYTNEKKMALIAVKSSKATRLNSYIGVKKNETQKKL